VAGGLWLALDVADLADLAEACAGPGGNRTAGGPGGLPTVAGSGR
jgi:hypothetical protein